jgi:hypothetical protein
MKRVPHVAQSKENGAAEFERECATLHSLATEVYKIDRRVRKARMIDLTTDIERRGELIASWWSQWMRLLPLARTAGIPLTELRKFQPPIG